MKLTILVHCVTMLAIVVADLHISGLPELCYSSPGDVAIGVVMVIQQYDPESPSQCGIADSSHLQYLEAIVYAVHNINQDNTLLTNLSLGFIVLDQCEVYRLNLAQASHFMPATNMKTAAELSSCDAGESYDVVALIGSGFSSHTVPIALAMDVAQIPIIGTTETSDELTDVTRFPTYIPFSLANEHQARAIVQLMAYYNWTYFILIYEEGSYAENGAKAIQKYATAHDLCIERAFLIFWNAQVSDMGNIYHYLSKYSVAQAVVVILTLGGAPAFFGGLDVTTAARFIWIGFDGVTYGNYGPPANGLLSINLRYGNISKFEAYYRTLTPINNAVNPWWNLLWEHEYDCMWIDTNSTNETKPNCKHFENFTLPVTTRVLDFSSIVYDSVLMAAYGLHGMFEQDCPAVFGNKTLIQECLNGERYLRAIRNVSFTGMTGKVSFNEEGDVSSGYIIKQYASEEDASHVVGSWSNVDGLMMHDELIDWTLYSDDGVIPESVCSHPCQPKQYVIQKAVKCCWECRDCRNNEIIVNNGTSCEVCPENTWPDDNTAIICERIQPAYLQLTDPIGILLAVLATIGFILTIITMALLVRHRAKKLIKASSKELLGIILVGMVMSFISAGVILTRPTRETCFLRDLGFSVSVTLIYAPLLVKTVRVYRIFQAGQQGKQSVGLISTRSQLTLTAAAISIQVLATVIVSVVSPSAAVTRMPILTEKYTELVCTLAPEVLAVLLVYNLMLLGTCAVVGFLSRKLPENFNESWFIFVSVTTTTFIWIVFLPTYFTTFYAYHKAALLSACLLLNGFITLVCLFLPKMYAVLYVDEEKMKYISHTSAVSNTM